MKKSIVFILLLMMTIYSSFFQMRELYAMDYSAGQSFVLTQASPATATPNAANPIEIPNVNIQIGTEQGNLSSAMQVVIVLTLLALLPAIVLMMTPFTRIIIIFSFIRRALGLQTIPPNQIVIGLSLFLTLYIMNPIFSQIYVNAYIPFSEGQIDQSVAFEKAMDPLRDYMFKQVRKDDLALFVKLDGKTQIDKMEDVSTTALVPAFIISELKTAFIIGFKLFIPFLVIDMVVASTLMALGMMMLPPVMISLPFKILLFVLVDGWNLLTTAILAGISI